VGQLAIRRLTSLGALVALCAAAVLAQTPGLQRPQSPAPARDQPAQQPSSPPTGRISGRVVAVDNGRPVKRARVSISAAELGGSRGALTADDGTFDLTELPAGRYTMTVSKSGFISLSYGQRRPLQAGTPLQLGDGQQMKGIEFRLPRGSIVSGHVYDEDGDPVPGITVRVLRYQYMQGDRRLTPVESSQTDDRGQYRVWGLMPGEYYVNAQVRLNFGGFGAAPGRGGRGGAPPVGPVGGFGRIAGPNGAATSRSDEDASQAYAATYYPGVTAVAEAKPIVVGLSEESLNNDFSLQLIRVARLAGRVSYPDGAAATSGNVSLLPDGALERGSQFGINYPGRIQWDGAFAISNVPPGRYILRARADDSEYPQFASQPITVGSGDLSDLIMILAEGASISGTLSFPGGSARPPDLTQIRIAAPSTEQQIGNSPPTRVDKDGAFVMAALPPGPHLIRPSGGNLRGWTLKSVTADARDITDAPVDLRSGQQLSNVVITFTDKTSEINGTISTDRGDPASEYTVLAFPTDTSYWRPQSRHIMTARPDQTGTFRIRGLPAGDYWVTTVDPAEQGEWFEPAYLDEHRLAAVRVTVGEGDTRTQNFRVRGQN
jgi:hypothetical protein